MINLQGATSTKLSKRRLAGGRRRRADELSTSHFDKIIEKTGSGSEEGRPIALWTSIKLSKRLPDCRSRYLVVDRAAGEKTHDLRQGVGPDEQDGLTEISNAVFLNKAAVAILLPVAARRVTIDEPAESIDACAIRAVHVPCDKEPGFAATGLAGSDPAHR